MNEDNSPAVFELDHHSAEFREDVHGAFRRMRESGCPVAYSHAHDGFWALIDYAPVFDASRDDELFSSCPSVGVPPNPVQLPILPIETDPPVTQELRRATLRKFSPREIDKLRPIATQITDELIDAFIERGSCDLVGELTTPMPARLTLRMLNFDESRYREWVHWAHAIVHDRAHSPAEAAAAGMQMFSEVGRHIQRRRTEGLGQDLLSDIMRGTINGQPLDDAQIAMYGIQMVLGGMDTTSGLTGNVLLGLCEDLRLRNELIADPSLIDRGTNEFIRLFTPTPGLARTVTRDVQFHGQHLRKGDRAILMWGAASRDPAIFDNPDRLDLHRPNAHKHMAFGVGVHRCLGSHMARMIFQVLLEQILQRLPDFALAGEPARFEDAGEVYALRTFPVTFTPAMRAMAMG